ncbi:MAG: hypothetical protein HS111_07065 [Kofleriaceae bacterium]|nr:hypothetical protein [Kofleriaceae bacterium]
MAAGGRAGRAAPARRVADEDASAPGWYALTGSRFLFKNNARSCGLGGVACDVCGNTWAEVGGSYPTISCSMLPDELADSRWPRPFPEYEQRRRAAAARIPDGRPLLPGVTFGPPTAAVKGEPAPA